MPRITRIAGSLAIVLIAYWAYALMAVPFIEPPAAEPGKLASGIPIGENGTQPATLATVVAEQMKQFAGLFPPDNWVWGEETKVLESDRATLLFKEYANQGDGRVEINPCSIVFAHDGEADDEAQRRRQSIILEAPAGAVLQFDQPINLNQPKMARLVGGQLRGAVTIRSDWKQPGPDDDLGIVTSDVAITEQSIATPNPVAFRWGPHFGGGQDMLIKLLPDRPKPAGASAGINVAGIESFELRRVDRLHLDLRQASLDKSNPTTTATKNEAAPVDITCQGPFRFDVVRHVATFRDRVDVVKQNPSGEPDKIACELLSLFFIERPRTAPETKTAKKAKAARKQDDSFDLTPERLEAQGNPVVVSAPSEQVVAVGQRIEYNLVKKSIALDGGQEVFLRQGPNEIHAKNLHYQSDGDGRLGQVAAQGPGWLRGQSPDRPGQMLEAAWRDQLRVYPHEQNQVISLSGGAELKFPGMGQLQSREIFFWLTESPPAVPGQKPRLRPNRMLARDEVNIRSPQLTGRVEQMEVWFDEAAQPSGMTAVQAAPAAPYGSPIAPSPTALATAPAQPPRQQFSVVGRLLRARVSLGNKETGVSHLLLEDGVQFVETQTSKPGERPMTIRGDRLELTDATGPEATVAIVGRPARFEARGLGLTGAAIHLDRGANRLWIEGTGQMDMPMSGDLLGGGLAGSPTSTQPQNATVPAEPPGLLTIDWRRRMEFDGRTARFEESVVAAGPRQRLNTDTMEVQFQRPINFSKPKMQEKPQIEEIRCHGGVALENRSFDDRRQLSSFDRMQAADLAVNVLSGAMLAGGPGWVNSVRHGTANDAFLGDRTGGASGTQANQGQLKCLHVKFQTSMTGNFLRRELTFNGQVRTTYGPVDNWDANIDTGNPDQLGPDGVALRCDQLSVVQMLLPLGGSRAVELAALGNATVEGTTFTARGNRVTYAESKGLLTLEGDGRNPAELFRQLQPGAAASRLPAQKILYWLKSKQVKVEGAQMMEVQLPDGKK